MMRSTWSISTTVRNPERLPGFLRVLKQLEGVDFTKDTQIKYQILLIKERLYTPMQIPLKHRDLFNDPAQEISYDIAKAVFDFQNYKDPPMRGRQSVNPLNKLGFCIAKERMGSVRITSLGDLFISLDADVSYIFFKSLLKLQFPNPMSTDFTKKKGFNIRPFVSAMHIMKKTGGLTQMEFSLFIPTLINYRDIDKYVEHVLKFRELASKKDREKFAMRFLKKFYGVRSLTNKQKTNPFEYGDNSMRYFRLTKYFRVEKHPFGHWKIDLEPSRMKEIDQLLDIYDGSAIDFDNVEDYIEYLSDISKPTLPWELDYSKSKDVAISLIEIVKKDYKVLDRSLQEELIEGFEVLVNKKLDELELKEVKKLIADLRKFRLTVIQYSRDRSLRRNVNELKQIVEVFKDKSKMRYIEPVEFEHMISQCLKIVNDEINIKPNYILDDDGNPIGFAPGNRADIEGYYGSFNSIFEVTLDVTRHQVYRESVPVMRHLKDFENNNADKPAFCVFIAPKIHDDTINYFWISVKYEFEGKKRKIVALELAHFVEFLEFFIDVIKREKTFTHYSLKTLLERIISNANIKNSSRDWFRDVPKNIKDWQGAIE